MSDIRTAKVYSDAYLTGRHVAGKWIHELSKLNPNMSHSQGRTYLCRTRDGYLKIGYSTNVARRMLDLKAELLYSLDGGESLELLAHYELAQYRIPCHGEKFFDRPAIYEWFKLRMPAQPSLTQQTCTECKVRKPVQQFGEHATSLTGYYRKCRVCRYTALPSFMRIGNPE